MLYAAIKVFLTAGLVVTISEIAKRSPVAGAIVASLPLTSLLAFVWLYADTGDADRVAQLSRGVFWYVLPSLVLFLAFPWLVSGGWGFWPAAAISCALTVGAYLLMVFILGRFGIAL